MLILPAEADEAMVSTAVDRISKVISPDGGEIGKLDRWGRRRFAYEIADQHEGYYVVVRFTAEPRHAAGTRPGAEARRRGDPAQGPARAGEEAKTEDARRRQRQNASPAPA